MPFVIIWAHVSNRSSAHLLSPCGTRLPLGTRPEARIIYLVRIFIFRNCAYRSSLHASASDLLSYCRRASNLIPRPYDEIKIVTSGRKSFGLTTPRYGPYRSITELWEFFPDLTATLHISSSEGKSFGLTTLRQELCRSIGSICTCPVRSYDKRLS